jgi:hypothetical protein
MNLDLRNIDLALLKIDLALLNTNQDLEHPDRQPTATMQTFLGFHQEGVAES